MRIVIAFALICGVAFVAPTIVSAAPLAVSDHAAATKSVAGSQAAVEPVGWRARARRNARRCTWQCTPYWRPYQYYNWQYMYPYGGPMF
jgi:hypothetical protein